VHEVTRGRRTVAAIVVGPVTESPLVFVKPGSYTSEEGKSKSAFTRGTLYFRHGAKSEPATSADLRAFIERRLETIRQDWLGGINRVISAPTGTEIVGIERTADAEGEPTRIRITTDADAPVYGQVSRDETHPYRQTELIKEVNKKLPGSKRINDYDSLSIRRAHNINAKTRPDFAYQPKFASCQYSDAFVDWIVEHYRKDSQFFEKARARYYELTQRGNGSSA